MAGLAQLRGVSRELREGNASICGFTSQQAHKGSRRTEGHTAPEPPLKSAIGELLHADVVSQREDTVNQLPVQALAVGRLLTVEFGQLALGVMLALRDDPRLFSLLDSSVSVVVAWIVGAALAICLTLQTPNFAVSPFQFVAKLAKLGLFRRNHAD